MRAAAARGKGVFAGLALLLGCADCGRHPVERSDSAPPAPSASAVVRLAPVAPIAPARPTCRIMGLEGDVRLAVEDAGASLSLQAPVPAEGWIELAPSARFVVRDPRTARETTFGGPGYVRACVAREEESWIAAGGFESSEGAGETPGAEEWVVTPLGVIRYGAAKVAIDVRARSVGVRMRSGAAFVWAADDAAWRPTMEVDSEGWVRISAETQNMELTLKGTIEPRAAARSAANRCLRQAAEARALATLLLRGTGASQTGDGGEVAAAGIAASKPASQVRARRLARAACAVARLRVQALGRAGGPMGGEVEIEAEAHAIVDQADSAWRTLPLDMGPEPVVGGNVTPR